MRSSDPGPLERRPRAAACRPAARMRSTSRSVTPVRATISAGSLAGERRATARMRRPSSGAASSNSTQRRTVTFFVTVVFFLACVSVIVAV